MNLVAHAITKSSIDACSDQPLHTISMLDDFSLLPAQRTPHGVDSALHCLLWRFRLLFVICLVLFFLFLFLRRHCLLDMIDNILRSRDSDEWLRELQGGSLGTRCQRQQAQNGIAELHC